MTDLHIHTKISYDSDEDAENYILAASRSGEGRLGFSEHYDYDVRLEDSAFALPDPNAITSSVCALNHKYPALEILNGIEFGYCADALPHYREILRSNKFDYAILSVHTLKGRGDCWFPEFFKGLSQKQAYENYFGAVLESVRSELDFQILGHLGYVSRHSPYEERKIIYSEYSGILDEILRAVIDRGVSLEINTSVGSSGAAFIPDVDVLLRYLELGGTNLTFGSDAHKANDYMRNSDSVKKFLNSCGVRELCYYKNRQLKREKL